MTVRFMNFRFYARSEKGSILPFAALVFPMVIGMAGVGVDVSSWMMKRHQLQAAADAGALAGAWELANGGSESDAEYAAEKEAANNGYDSSIGTLTITVGTDSSSGSRTVQADVQEQVDVWFANMFVDHSFYANTTATAEEVAGGGFCLLGLDQTEIGAVSASGSVNLESPNCGIAVNSESNSALQLNGSVTMHVGDVRLVGDYAEGGSTDFTYSSMRTGAAPTQDPYSDLDVPPFTGCDQTAYSTTHDANLTPGTYCGGITVTGNNTINLAPGTYVMDGGDFSIAGGGSITGTGVTIILTNSGNYPGGTYGNMDMSGNKTMNLSAPTTGDYAGVVVYQDRNAPDNGTSNKVTGNAGFEMEGVIYTPSREMEFGGNSRINDPDDPLCTKVISKKVMFHGNPTLGSDCTGKGTRNIGNASAKLVL